MDAEQRRNAVKQLQAEAGAIVAYIDAALARSDALPWSFRSTLLQARAAALEVLARTRAQNFDGPD